MVLQEILSKRVEPTDAFDEWLSYQIHSRLELMLQPRLDCMLATENASMRAKIVELRNELTALSNLTDNMRQQNTRLQEMNEQLRRDNLALQM